MNKLQQTFEQFLATSGVQVNIGEFILNLALTGLLAFILSYIYVKFGRSISNRRAFSRNFVLITLTTMLIITIVKSSLALSLGLVGALSIVRFRTAIKEPEELAYMFLCIAIGVGIGANQRSITIVAFLLISSFIVLLSRLSKNDRNRNMNLVVNSRLSEKISLSRVVDILREHCSEVSLKRFDETSEMFEAFFLIEFDSFDNLDKVKHALKESGDSVKISFIDRSGAY